MTSTPAKRVRRSLKYLQFDMEGDHRVRYGSLDRDRITVSERVDTERFQNTQDWVRSAGVNASARLRVPENRRGRPVLLTADGIHRTLARAILGLLACMIAVLLLVELGAIGISRANIRKMNEKIAAVEERNELLRQDLARASGDVSVCTEAIRLNLISSGGARSIVLTAPEGASLMLTDKDGTGVKTTEEPELRASAE